MKHFILLILVFSLIGSSPSSHASQMGLKQAIAELTYALEVEWDQKDKDFYADQMNLFRSRLEKLKLDGKSNSTILKEALSALPASSTKASIQKALEQVDADKMQPQELQQMLIKLSKESKQTGANWNSLTDGSLIIPGLIAFAVLIFVIPLLLTADDGEFDNDNVHGGTQGGTTAGTDGGTSGGTTGGTDGGTSGGTTGGTEPTPTPDPGPTYQCTYKWICYTYVTGYYDPFTGTYLNGYQDSCGHQYVCGTW